MKKLTRILAVAAFGGLAAGAAHGQTIDTTFTVSANVVNACTVSAVDLAFGDYVASAAKDGSSAITVTCSAGRGYTVGISGGATPRSMTGPGGSLNYGLFSDTSRTSAFSVAASGTGGAVVHPVYGRIPAGQFVTAGAYSETVTVLVTY